MREIIKDLNKRALAEGTGISYSRLRKYAASEVKDLTKEEREKIYDYLISLSDIFKGDSNDSSKL